MTLVLPEARVAGLSVGRTAFGLRVGTSPGLVVEPGEGVAPCAHPHSAENSAVDMSTAPPATTPVDPIERTGGRVRRLS